MSTYVLLIFKKETKLRIFSMLLIYKVFLENVKKNNTFTLLTVNFVMLGVNWAVHKVYETYKLGPLKSLG